MILRVGIQVSFQKREGSWRELQTERLCVRKQGAQAQSHSAGASAQIQASGDRDAPEPRCQFLHENDGVLPGNQNPFSHLQRQAHELPLAQQILKGPPGSPLFDGAAKGGRSF